MNKFQLSIIVLFVFCLIGATAGSALLFFVLSAIHPAFILGSPLCIALGVACFLKQAHDLAGRNRDEQNALRLAKAY